MLSFFRKMRGKWIGDEAGKATGRYLFYAIGEILLVVVGILIALQVNNWNEDRSARDLETKLLAELYTDLKETRADLLSDVATVTQHLEVTDRLYQSLYDSEASQQNYEVPFWYILTGGSLYPKRSAYLAIQSAGLTLIQNDSLRIAISDLYELRLTRIRDIEDAIDQLQEQDLRPLMVNNSRSLDPCTDCTNLTDRMAMNEQNGEVSRFVLDSKPPGLEKLLKLYHQMNFRLRDIYQDMDNKIIGVQQGIEAELQKYAPNVSLPSAKPISRRDPHRL